MRAHVDWSNGDLILQLMLTNHPRPSVPSVIAASAPDSSHMIESSKDGVLDAGHRTAKRAGSTQDKR